MRILHAFNGGRFRANEVGRSATNSLAGWMRSGAASCSINARAAARGRPSQHPGSPKERAVQPPQPQERGKAKPTTTHHTGPSTADVAT